jgi:hypothetical protein
MPIWDNLVKGDSELSNENFGIIFPDFGNINPSTLIVENVENLVIFERIPEFMTISMTGLFGDYFTDQSDSIKPKFF